MAVPTPARDVLILGIGNPLMGDDGVGIRVIEMLTEQSLPPGVILQEAGLPGWGLPSWFEGHDNVILIDAVQMGGKPGNWKRFRPDDLRVVLEDGTLSLHQPGLASGLALSQALQLLPPNLILYGIEPAQTSACADLSPEVCTSLSEVVQSILNDL